jgi:hypothetical protein
MTERLSTVEAAKAISVSKMTLLLAVYRRFTCSVRAFARKVWPEIGQRLWKPRP